MGQILIRNLDDRVIAALKRRAAAAGRSMEAEARAVLTRDTGATTPDRRTVIARMQAEFDRLRVPGSAMPDSLELLRESRDNDAG
jgi:plasmid stability protein